MKTPFPRERRGFRGRNVTGCRASADISAWRSARPGPGPVLQDTSPAAASD